MKHAYNLLYENVYLRPLTEADIEALRQWRNNPKNSVYLSKTPYITPKMQKDWFDKYSSNIDEICFAIVEVKTLNRLVGSLSLYGFESNSCLFGKLLIGDDEAHGQNVGLNATIAAIKIAFEQLKLKRVNLFVFKDNIAACKIYAKVGFVVIDEHLDAVGQNEITMSIENYRRMKMTNINKVRMLEFPQRGDNRGQLIIVEGNKDIPFDIKRVFYIYGSDVNTIRGQHANKQSEFVLINVVGTCKIRVTDGKGNKRVFALNRPHVGIYLPTMIWKDMYDFSSDSVLLVLASTHYNPEEYIRDYNEYVKELEEKNSI